MRGLENPSLSFSNPLTPTLFRRERGLSGTAVTSCHELCDAVIRNPTNFEIEFRF